MTEITIRPATAERFEDAEHALTGGGDGPSCWCQWFMITTQQFKATTRDEKRALLRGDLANEAVPSALIAYVDGEAAGWLKLAPRPRQPRLANTRNIRSSPEPLEDEHVWAMTCFVIRREHRGHGLSRKLLEAGIDHARAHGARVIEAYPVDTAVKKTSNNDLYHGALSTFLAAGFSETARPSERRPIVALTLR